MSLKVIPLGGLGEIGMNCMILEWQDEILVIDCGILFSDLDQFGVEFAIPDFSYLKENKDKVKGILLTHGHEDHIGALPFLIRAGIDAPIYASPFTSLMVREKLREAALESRVEIKTFQMGQPFEFKNFKVKPVSVNHSIVDSAALLIDTPIGKVIHTGDFKIDPTPFIGSSIDLAEFGRAGDEGVLLLLSDSTNVEKHEHSVSEKLIYSRFEQLFAAAEGLIVVSMFSSNVARMGQIFEIAAKTGKKVALSGRSMEQNVRLGIEAGYLPYATTVMIATDQIKHTPRDQLIVLSTGSQGESRSSLIRMAYGEHPTVKLGPKDLVLMSSKFIPGNEKPIGKMINQLFKQGAEVLYESVHEIHVSGHATRPELLQMLELTKPRFFVPIHGEYRHLVHHAKLATQDYKMLAERVLIAVNGDVISVDPQQIKVTEHKDENRVLVEGRDGNDITKLVLKERKQLGEKGVVFTLLVRNADSRRIMAGPEIICRGLVNEDLEGWLIEEARSLVRKLIEKYDEELNQGRLMMDLQETIRVEVRRFLNNNIGKKPIVMPIILDL